MSATRNRVTDAVEAFRAAYEALPVPPSTTTAANLQLWQRFYDAAYIAAPILLRAAAEPEAKAPTVCGTCHDVTMLSGVPCSKHGCDCACHKGGAP